MSFLNFITINGQNGHVAIGLYHQTTSVLNDVIGNDVSENDVIDSLMNMHKLLEMHKIKNDRSRKRNKTLINIICLGLLS